MLNKGMLSDDSEDTVFRIFVGSVGVTF